MEKGRELGREKIGEEKKREELKKVPVWGLNL